jgi:hypothetical protein
MEKKTQKKKFEVRCACAIGDLSEMAEVKPVIRPVAKTQTQVPAKDLKKDNTRKKSDQAKHNEAIVKHKRR